MVTIKREKQMERDCRLDDGALKGSERDPIIIDEDDSPTCSQPSETLQNEANDNVPSLGFQRQQPQKIAPTSKTKPNPKYSKKTDSANKNDDIVTVVKLIPHYRRAEFNGVDGTSGNFLRNATKLKIEYFKTPSEKNPKMQELHVTGPRRIVQKASVAVDRFLKRKPNKHPDSDGHYWYDILKSLRNASDFNSTTISSSSDTVVSSVGISEGHLQSHKQLDNVANKFGLDTARFPIRPPLSVEYSCQRNNLGQDLEERSILIPKWRKGEFLGPHGNHCREFQNFVGLTNVFLDNKPSENDPEKNNVRIRGYTAAIMKGMSLLEQFLKLPASDSRAAGKSWLDRLNAEQKKEMEHSNARIIPTDTISTTQPKPPKRQKFDLFQLLSAHRDCLKCSVEQFHTWLQSEDICTVEDLVEALSIPTYVKEDMQKNGLKGFKKSCLRDAAVACLSLPD